MTLLAGLEILQSAADDAAPVARKTVEIAGRLAQLAGAKVYVDANFQCGHSFLQRDKHALEDDPGQWLAGGDGRLLLKAVASKEVAPPWCAMFLSAQGIETLSAGEDWHPRDNGRCHQTADGVWLAVSAGSVAGEDVAQWCLSRTAESATTELWGQGISAAVVADGSQMLASAVTTSNDIMVRSPNGDQVKGFPFQFRHTPMQVLLDSPGIDEHNRRFIND